MKYPLQQLGKIQYQRAYRMFYAAKRKNNNVYFQQVHSLSSYFRYKKDMVVNKHKLKRETRYPFVTHLIADAYFYNEHKLFFSTKHPTRIKMRPTPYQTSRRK